jgi:hypothetical protein
MRGEPSSVVESSSSSVIEDTVMSRGAELRFENGERSLIVSEDRAYGDSEKPKNG